jgi:hypothetical protein
MTKKIGRGEFFVCPVWSWPGRIRRMHETMYAFGPLRYRVWRRTR